MRGGKGLVRVRLEELERLLSRVHSGVLPCPFGMRELNAAGLSFLADRVDFLQGLDEPAVRAVVVAVIAERRNIRKIS